MKRILTCMIAGFIPLTFFALPANGGGKGGDGGTFEIPDFAFPCTVENRARKVLKQSVPGNPHQAIKALIQIMVAETSVSTGNFQSVMKLGDSVAQRLPVPYNNIVRSLQAQAYEECYRSDARLYNERNLPLQHPWPADVKEWSRDMFLLKIMELNNDALCELSVLQQTPLSVIADLLNGYSEEQQRYLPAVFDLLVWRACDMLQTFAGNQRIIPFTTDPAQLATAAAKASAMQTRLMKQLEQVNANHPDALALAYVRQGEHLAADRGEYLLGRYRSLEESPASLMVLDALSQCVDDNDNEADNREFKLSEVEYYKLCREGLHRFPKANFAPNISATIKNIERIEVSVTPTATCVTGDSVAATVRMRNINSCRLLMVRVAADGSERYVDYKTLMKGKVVASAIVQSEGQVPFVGEVKVRMAPAPTGYYVLLVSESASPADAIGVTSLTEFPLMRVGTLSAFTTGGGKEDSHMLYVVDVKRQKPVHGAEVKIISDEYPSRGRLLAEKLTDSQGMVQPGKGHNRLQISKESDSFSFYSYNYRHFFADDNSCHMQVLTDLSLYHPGDSVGFAAIVYEKSENRFAQMSGRTLVATLMDVNGEEVDSLRIDTDSFGRAHGSFKLPAGGVTGSYSIEIADVDNSSCRGTATVMVAEYKAPTFFVELDSIASEYVSDADILISGKVQTYSGMPVADAVVTLRVEHMPFWIWWRQPHMPAATYGTSSVADADGRFSFRLPVANLKDTPFATGRFSARVTAVSQAGESRESELCRFALGKSYDLQLSAPERIETSAGMLKVDAKVLNAVGVEQSLPLSYSLRNKANGNVVAEGIFTAPALELPLADLPSAEYEIKIVLQADTAVTASVATVVYRNGDKRPPLATSLWLPQQSIVAEPGKKIVKIPVGNSYPGELLFCSVASDTAIISRRWLTSNGGNMMVEVPAPADNGRLYVSFVALHGFQSVRGEVEILPAEATRRLNVKIETFRDKLTPGTEECWTFRFVDNMKGIPGKIPALAVMTDKSLNALYDFNWYFKPAIYFNSSVDYDIYSLPSPQWHFGIDRRNNARRFSLSVPDIDTYDRELYADGYGRRYYLCGAASVRSERVSEEMAECDLSAAPPMANSMRKNSAAVEESAGGAEQAREDYREAEHPLAFFKPMLVSDADGRLDVKFNVPNFNTTWQFQLLGYDGNLRTAQTKLYSVASKPIMVQALVPRFLRTDDSVMLCATLFNNTDSIQTIAGTFEIFNPLTGEVMKCATRTYTVAAKSSVVMSLPFTTPTDEQSIGLRVRAEGGDFADGEQLLVGILPSSSPIFEATNFYLAPKQRNISVALPSFKENASVWLQYCNNPVWYCVSALPEISTPGSDNLLSLLYAYFGNSLASGLVRKYPVIADAVALWRDTQMPVSELQQNMQLKTMALENTVWVRNARSETMRMSRLAELLDTAANSEVQKSLVKKIASLQCADGGWQWFPGMDPSLYLTTSVLLYMGQLQHMGCLPESAEIQGILDKGIAFADSTLLEEYKRIQKARAVFPLQYMLDYFYIRSFYTKTYSRELASLRRKTVDALKSRWRDLDIYHAATAAITLHRCGETAYAGKILTSLRQYASSSPEKGIWFDNLRSSYSSFGTLITTAQVLEAYRETAPEATAEIDGLRQWLILQRQAQEWGDNRNTAEVIYAILGSGTDFTGNLAPAVIILGDSILVPDRVQQLTGEFVMHLDARSASGTTLRIDKSGEHPAWGGVMSQSVSPMVEVKEASVPDLHIQKRCYRIVSGAAGEVAEDVSTFKPGDRMRVALTITCGRDMEYVAVSDQRAACLEPISQLPGFDWQNGIGFYLEPRNAQTNIFISFLPKGVHTIVYDCFVQQSGTFALGIATAQSQYAPMLTAHSSGALLKVEP